MWSLYRKQTNNFKKALILEKIAELQTFISPYYEASKWILENNIKHEQESKRSVSNT